MPGMVDWNTHQICSNSRRYNSSIQEVNTNHRMSPNYGILWNEPVLHNIQ